MLGLMEYSRCYKLIVKAKCVFYGDLFILHNVLVTYCCVTKEHKFVLKTACICYLRVSAVPESGHGFTGSSAKSLMRL